MSVPETLEAFHAGSVGLFRLLVERHSPMLLSVAVAHTGDEDEAHDAVQATWVLAFRRRRQLESLPALPGWLVTICRNVIRSEGRKTAARERKLMAVARLDPDTTESADARVSRNEVRRVVSEAVAELPPRQQEVVVLRILEGHTTRECARRLDIAEGTVKAALHHALANLHPKLRSLYDDLVS